MGQTQYQNVEDMKRVTEFEARPREIIQSEEPREKKM